MIRHRPPAAVLFDMDGTLIDSEKVWAVALGELAAHYGGELTDAVRRQLVGASSAYTMATMLEHLRQPWRDPAAGSAWLDRRVAELFVDELQWRPGALELLTAVRRAGIPVALVTNTNRPLVEVVLRTIGPFDAVVAGDDVARPKPDPQPYQRAAELLRVDPHDCVAVEDSPAGIASARAAGCAVVAVPSELPLSDVDGYRAASLLDVGLDTLAQVLAGDY
jgi:HAD superfamily hydrolase (TIGR01509 family)